jgi:hypothetical protein
MTDSVESVLQKLAENQIEGMLHPPLLHGDEKHQEWLKAELRAQIPSLIERLRSALEAMLADMQKDYEGMRHFQRAFIAADQENTKLRGLLPAFHALVEWLRDDTLEIMKDTMTMGITFDQADSSKLRAQIEIAESAINAVEEALSPIPPAPARTTDFGT